MTKKQIEATMLELLNKVDREYMGHFPERLDRSTWNWDNWGQGLDALEQVSKLSYEEQRMEQALKQVIEKSKAKMVELIQDENAFTAEEKEASALLKIIKDETAVLRKQYEDGHVNAQGKSAEKLIRAVRTLRDMLRKDLKIIEALGIVARDLEILMKQLGKAEE